MTAVQAQTGGSASGSSLQLDGPQFVALCRDLLARAGEVRFEAQGLSMRPTILPGEVLCVTPLGPTLPRPGEVLLVQAHSGKAVAHRVVATRRGPRGRQFITCGDATVRDLDGVLHETDILGRVVAYERGGVREPLAPRRPMFTQALRARWRLFLHAANATRSPVARVCARVAGLPGRGLGGLAALPAQMRRSGLLRGVSQGLWPDVAGRCRVEEAQSGEPGGARQMLLLEAWVGAKPAGDAVLLRVPGAQLPPRAEGDGWVLTGLRVRTLYRSRGVAARLAAVAASRASAGGAGELVALVEPQNEQSLAELENVGFARLPEDAPVLAVVSGAPGEEAAPAVITLRLALTPAVATTPPTQ